MPSGLWQAYTRLPRETRLRLGVAGVLFSVLGIVASPGLAPSLFSEPIQFCRTTVVRRPPCPRVLPSSAAAEATHATAWLRRTNGQGGRMTCPAIFVWQSLCHLCACDILCPTCVLGDASHIAVRVLG